MNSVTVQGQEDVSGPRDLVFISKATPGDDDFALWLAPRLEAAGYKVFADILCLKYGDRWRQILTRTLHERAVKMLLCCRDSTLARNGVQEEIGIAEDLTKQLGDPRFIIPIKLERYKKLFGIGELQRVDFEPSWADGLNDLLAFLDEEDVPRSANGEVNPEWANFRTRRSLSIQHEPEPLVSNWLRVSSVPDTIKYYVPTGAISLGAVTARCKESLYPAHYHNRGILTFMNFYEVAELFADVASLKMKCKVNTLDFDSHGMPDIDLSSKDAHNILMSMLRQAWHTLCREKELIEYPYAALTGFHVGEAQVDIGTRVPWGRQGDRRSAMLRNIAKGKVWNFGVSAIPAFWPYLHFKFKTRVLFSELIGEKQPGDVIDNVGHQFRLRRTVCKGWRNKQWYGRFLAFLEILSGDSAFITLTLSPTEQLKVEAEPITFTSPITTALPDEADDDYEEADESVLADRDLPPEDTNGETDSGPS